MASKDTRKHSTESPTPAKKTKNIEAKAPRNASNQKRELTVVGIGASAGGLEDLKSFFTVLPGNTGMAFVVVTHLHPEHESHLAELLQRNTSMPTMQVTRKTRLEPNHVYVIPPNRSILMTDAHLDIREFEEPHGHRTPVDLFFRSMDIATRHGDGTTVVIRVPAGQVLS